VLAALASVPGSINRAILPFLFCCQEEVSLLDFGAAGLPRADEEKLGPFRIVMMSRRQIFVSSVSRRAKSWQVLGKNLPFRPRCQRMSVSSPGW